MATAAATEQLVIRSVEDLSGTQRAAILLMYLSEEVARGLLAHMSTRELQEIALAIATVDTVEASVIEEVVAQFVRDMHGASMVKHSGRDYALDVLPRLVSDDRRVRVESSIRRQISTEFEEYIADRPARTVATILQDEHVQTQAVGLLLMGADNAAAVLECFEEQERYDVTLRMAALETVPGELADDVEAALRGALEDHGTDRWKVQGVDDTAQILGRLGRVAQEPLLDRLEMEDAELSDRLRRRMVVFTDLSSLDPRGAQALLKGIDRSTLLLALRGATSAMRELFLAGMSKRASADLRDDLEIMGPTPRAQVEAAQEEVVQVALKLQEEGAIQLCTGGQTDLV